MDESLPFRFGDRDVHGGQPGRRDAGRSPWWWDTRGARQTLNEEGSYFRRRGIAVPLLHVLTVSPARVDIPLYW